MDTAHLHLLLNHFPIVGGLIGTLILLYAMFRKNEAIIRTGLFTILIMALIAIPVFLTGEPAEERVEDIAGVSEVAIHEHEEAAEFAFWIMMAAGGLALLSLFSYIKNSTSVKLLTRTTCVVAVVSFAAMARTGYLGGKIRHTEIAGHNAAAANGEQGQESEEEEEEKEQD